jgi:RNA polymerase sigma-70 factor (ECF subfamily)
MDNRHTAKTPNARFDQIVVPHLDAAHNLARWLLRGKDDAEDVVQEAFLRAFQYFSTFNGGNARAWLLAIVRNTAFRWLQRNRRQQLAVEFDEDLHTGDGDSADPETLLLRVTDRQLLERAMRQLPAHMREVLALRELEGLSYKEIADVIGAPIGTVMSTLHRARERFRQATTVLAPGAAEALSGISPGQARSVWVDAKDHTT